jgi:hypothetical protein
MKAYSVKHKKMMDMVKITSEKKMKNGTTLVQGVASDGSKLSTIRK